jgi:hypothetical protein
MCIVPWSPSHRRLAAPELEGDVDWSSFPRVADSNAAASDFGAPPVPQAVDREAQCAGNSSARFPCPSFAGVSVAAKGQVSWPRLALVPANK